MNTGLTKWKLITGLSLYLPILTWAVLGAMRLDESGIIYLGQLMQIFFIGLPVIILSGVIVKLIFKNNSSNSYAISTSLAVSIAFCVFLVYEMVANT